MDIGHALTPVDMFRKEVFDQIGDLQELDIFNTDILVAIWQRPTKTAGGIIMPDQVLKEDEFQGKAGLLLKKGPAAFEDAKGVWFQDANINVGDWLIYRPSDAWRIDIHGVKCRIIRDDAIRCRVASPEMVW